MLLRSYPSLRTRNLDEVKAALKVNSFSNRIDLPAGRRRDQFITNAAHFEEAGLVFIRYDSPVSLEVNPRTDILIGYQIREVSEVVVDGEVIENGVHQAGCLVPSERSWCVRNPTGYEVLILRVATKALRRKLSALMGSDCVRLDLRQPSSVGAARALIRESAMNFAKELDVADPRFLRLLVANSTEDICVRILSCLSAQFLEVDRSPAAPSEVQLGRVEQYIVANFAEPLSVETLAEISGVSAHSVFRHFLARYDCTPHEYLDRIRLEMAYAKLLACHDKGSVASVALQCGFPSLGYFVRAYRNRFGESPSPMAGGRRPRRR
jgi:AraC-like DNA-binding protein